MMAYFAHNDISILLNFYLWQPVYYILDLEDQSFGVKSTEKSARWAGIDEKIGIKMCYKLVNDKSRKIVCRSVIWSATGPSTTNLQIDPIEPLPPDAIPNTELDAMLDEMMIFADFEISLSDVDMNDPVVFIQASIKSKIWQEMEKDRQMEHQEDVQ